LPHRPCWKNACCKRMLRLQVFHMDIAKVDRDVAYVAMVCVVLPPFRKHAILAQHHVLVS
jgi:hypothetical protein